MCLHFSRVTRSHNIYWLISPPASLDRSTQFPHFQFVCSPSFLSFLSVMLILLKMQLRNLRGPPLHTHTHKHTCHSAPVSAVRLISESQNSIASSAAKPNRFFVTVFQESLVFGLCWSAVSVWLKTVRGVGGLMLFVLICNLFDEIIFTFLKVIYHYNRVIPFIVYSGQ